jgi:hypothetical protein
MSAIGSTRRLCVMRCAFSEQLAERRGGATEVRQRVGGQSVSPRSDLRTRRVAAEPVSGFGPAKIFHTDQIW